MSLFSWLTRKISGEEVGTVTFAPGEEHFHGLNMREAIDAHVNWKNRLEAQLTGDAEKLEIGQVAADDRCTLGTWIHGPGKQQYGKLPEFAELMREHANFHLTAGKILMDVHEGKVEDARKLLHGGEFRHASDTVQLSLVRLYAQSRSG